MLTGKGCRGLFPGDCDNSDETEPWAQPILLALALSPLIFQPAPHHHRHAFPQRVPRRGAPGHASQHLRENHSVHRPGNGVFPLPLGSRSPPQEP